jgi:ATP-dependent DNA ligase
MKPMLARTIGPKFASFPCYLQPKLNGVRALYQAEVFQSRDKKLWQVGVLSHLLEELATIKRYLGPIILDGELYVHGWKLQRINGAVAVNRREPIPDTLKICYYVFDVVDTSRNFSERFLEETKQILIEAALPHIQVVSTCHAWLREEVDLEFTNCIANGFEGIMLRPDGPYELNKRSKYLWKYKSWHDAEFICVGVTTGQGKAAIGIGALICTIGPNGPTFEIGTGFSDDERIEFAENSPVGKLIRVKYNPDLTNAGRPTHASFLAVMS